MKSCWNADPDRRPLFTELVDRLGDFLEKDKIKVRFNVPYNMRGIEFAVSLKIDNLHIFQ